jgi:hypothetical protein
MLLIKGCGALVWRCNPHGHLCLSPALPCRMDRPALSGFDIVEQLEKEFGLQSYPVTW